MTIYGTGFSSNIRVFIDDIDCSDVRTTNFSMVTCRVPPTNSTIDRQTSVKLVDGSTISNGSTMFTYTVANTATVLSIVPAQVNVNPGQMMINGTLFGTSPISVTIGSTQSNIVSWSTTEILVDLPRLPAGRYSVNVLTINGYARPTFDVEYRFYVSEISPQTGSLYGGTDVFVYGDGFDNRTEIQLITEDQRQIECRVKSYERNRILCQTETVLEEVIITSDGIDPNFGQGFAWSPQHVTIEQGTKVTWKWASSPLLPTIRYKIQQVDNSYTTEPMNNGFDSGSVSPSGSD